MAETARTPYQRWAKPDRSPPVTTSWMGGTPRIDWYSYMKDNPALFQPGYKWYTDPFYSEASRQAAYGFDPTANPNIAVTGEGPVRRLMAEIGNLNALKKQFAGPESTYIRWLIGREMTAKQNQLADARASQQDTRWRNAVRQAEHHIATGIETGDRYLERYGRTLQAQALTGQARHLARGGGSASIPLAAAPIPGWMESYIDPSVPTHEAATRGLGRRGASVSQGGAMLRPIGAQAELGSEQLGQMAGYLGWQKAGAPTKFSEGALAKMGEWQRPWSEYSALSQKLFPTQYRSRTSWATARQ